jgi:AcrR family transcriptional regulator
VAEVCTRPGRPRSTQADEAILDAAIDVFVDLGYEGLTMEAVAERAGVAKSTVYRRYPSKPDLLTAALRCGAGEKPDPPDTGSLLGDLRQVADNVRGMLRESTVGRMLPATLAAAARHPEFARVLRQFVADRRRSAIRAVRAAVARGEVPADVDADLLVDLVIAPVFYRFFHTGGPVDDGVLDELVHRAVGAFTIGPRQDGS